jgi:hypothetical protein
MAYFFLLRGSEYLQVGSTRHSYCLKTANVYFADHEGHAVPSKVAVAVTIGLSGSKNDQFGRGAWRTMQATGDALLCPKKALQHILIARKELRSQDQHLCADLRAAEVNQALKSLATTTGVSPTAYSTHSARIGGATALLNGKADSLTIKLLGRWMSNCFEGYPVLTAKATKGLSRRMI